VRAWRRNFRDWSAERPFGSRAAGAAGAGGEGSSPDRPIIAASARTNGKWGRTRAGTSRSRYAACKGRWPLEPRPPSHASRRLCAVRGIFQQALL